MCLFSHYNLRVGGLSSFNELKKASSDGSTNSTSHELEHLQSPLEVEASVPFQFVACWNCTSYNVGFLYKHQGKGSFFTTVTFLTPCKQHI
jgi:hypothetical protein